ncbi:MAG: hypothetical protein F6K35_04540 [Okeania sp. SIO2H7]|nr:hypothetical protein [Okeania sp. SIO2H7]
MPRLKRKKKSQPQLKDKKKSQQKVTNGANPTVGIDLGDDDIEADIDVGLGSVEAEVTLIDDGNVQVKAVAGIDVSPATLDVNYDSVTGELAVAGQVGLPGDLAGLTGGITIDTDTGELTAITGGLAALGVGIEVEVGVGSKSCRKAITFTFLEIGLVFIDDSCKREDEDKEDEGDEPEPEPEPEENYPPPGDRIPPGYTGPLCRIVRTYTKIYYSYTWEESNGGQWYAFKRGAEIVAVVVGGYAPPTYLHYPRGWLGGYSGFQVLYSGGSADDVWMPQPGDYFPPRQTAEGVLIRDSTRNSISGNFIVGVDYYSVNPPGGTGSKQVKTFTYYTTNVYWSETIMNLDALEGRQMLDYFEYKEKVGDTRTEKGDFLYDWFNIGSSGMYQDDVRDIWGCVLELPPPPSPSPSPSPPRPQPPPLPPFRNRGRNPMSDCCQANLRLNRENNELLKKISNVTGISEEYQYPQPVEVDGEIIETVNLIDFLINQPDLSKIIGTHGRNKPSLWPKEILVQPATTSRNPVKVKINNITELLDLVGGSTGYSDRENSRWPQVYSLEKDRRRFTYRSLGDAVTELLQVLAPHKMLYGTKDNGYAIPLEQLFPGAKGYDFTKDYLGIYTRLFSATQRYGFDSPVYIKIKDANPALEGDQEAGYEIQNLAGAIEKLHYYNLEMRGDVDALTNISVRLGYLLTRSYQMMTRTFYRVTAILDGLGIPVRNKRITFPCEFDPSAGVEHKGYERRNDNDDIIGVEEKLDLHDDDTTEKLLPKFLSISHIPQVVNVFNKESPNLFKMLFFNKIKMGKKSKETDDGEKDTSKA